MLQKKPGCGGTYHYFACVYKAKDAFWLVQFATLEENFKEYFDQIIVWANSVEFAN